MARKPPSRKKPARKKTTRGKKSRPPTPTSERNYKKEYARDGKPKQDKLDRALRNAAHNALNPGTGKEVDHKKPLSKGGTNSKKNLRVVSRSANRKKGSKLITRKKGS